MLDLNGNMKKWLDNTENTVDVTSIQYRVDEYLALNGEISLSDGSLGDFSREEIENIVIEI